MSKFLSPVRVAVATLAVCIMSFVGCGGCAAGKGQLNPATGVYDATQAGDPLVVSVENIREIALDAFDNAMRLESANREVLLKINPGIHTGVEVIRRDGQKVLVALTEAKTAFQVSRSAEDATKLKNALASVQSLLRSAVKYLAEMAAAPKGTP